MQVTVSGYHHKQSILLSRIVEKMAQFVVDHKRFAIHKETLARQLKNFNANQPYRYRHIFIGLPKPQAMSLPVFQSCYILCWSSAGASLLD